MIRDIFEMPRLVHAIHGRAGFDQRRRRASSDRRNKTPICCFGMIRKGEHHDTDKHAEAVPGTTDQRPRWEGPPENRPRGYKPAKDDPARDRDAAGENLSDPERHTLADALKHKGPRR